MSTIKICESAEHGATLVKAYATVTIIDSEDHYNNTSRDYCQDHTNVNLKGWMSGGMRENKTYSVRLVD